MKILLGGTGSVAAIKYWKLFSALEENANEVRGVLTEKAVHFVKNSVTDCDFGKIITEQEEWSWDKIGDPIPHIDLRDWADVLVIAPLTANTLSKMANGLCDNLLTSIYRAWPMSKPIVVAPAMNTEMWNHPLTAKQLHTLQQIHGYFGDWNYAFRVVKPVSKKLACGTDGIGAMAPIDNILDEIKFIQDCIKKNKFSITS